MIRTLGLALCLVGLASRPIVALGQEVAGQSAVKACLSANVDTDESAQLTPVVRDCTIAIAASSPASADWTPLHIQRGVAFRNAGDLESSLADLAVATTQSPHDVLAIRMHAWTLRLMQRHLEALELYNQALAIEDEWQGRLSRCVVLSDLSRISEAIVDCEKVLEQLRVEDSLYFTARLYHLSNQNRKALELLAEAQRSGQAIARTYMLASEVQLALSNKAAALESVQTGLRLFPEDRVLLDQKQKLQQ